jgi:hypothetical protein
MAVSASKVRFWIQSLGLECRLYLGPFSSTVSCVDYSGVEFVVWLGSS